LNGYTLVELIIVLLIIGILFSIVFPNFKNFLVSSQSKKGISEFENILNSASENSIITKKKIYFILNLENQEYSIKEENCEESNFSPLPKNIFIYKAKNSSYETISKNISFIFYPDGTKDFGVIYLRNYEDGNLYTFFLSPYSEKVKILNGEVYFEAE